MHILKPHQHIESLLFFNILVQVWKNTTNHNRKPKVSPNHQKHHHYSCSNSLNHNITVANCCESSCDGPKNILPILNISIDLNLKSPLQNIKSGSEKHNAEENSIGEEFDQVILNIVFDCKKATHLFKEKHIVNSVYSVAIVFK